MLSFLALVGALVGCTGADEPEETAPRPPDRILILVDTLRADAMSYAGNSLPTSPQLDKLAAGAAWFSRAYSPSTWTLPATASIFTGCYPWQHRVVHDASDPNLFGRLSAKVPTIASALKARGYRTAAFINNAFMAPEFGLNQGFDTFDFHGADLIDHRTAQETVDLALKWLEGSDEPAFLVVHAMEPHADYQVAPPYKGRFTEGLPHTLEVPLGGNIVDRMIMGLEKPDDDDKAYIHAAYHEEVLATDAAMGTLLDGLRAREGWDEAVVVFTSDHGEEFWEHGTYEHGHITNSEVTRVPLVVKAPGVKPGENRSVVSLVDLYPLLVDDGGDVLRLARSGAYEAGRVAVSEDTLYTEPQTSAVSDDLRVTANLARRTVWFHTMDAAGVESVEPTEDPEIQAKGEPLLGSLRALRGGMQMTPAPDSVAIPGPEVFNKLRNLGYVDAPATPTTAPDRAPAGPPPGCGRVISAGTTDETAGPG